jgi:hypothetical protein
MCPLVLYYQDYAICAVWAVYTKLRLNCSRQVVITDPQLDDQQQCILNLQTLEK